MPYVLIASILLYLLVIRIMSFTRLGILPASLIVIGGPFILTAIIEWIRFGGPLIDARVVLTTIVQIGLALFIFYRLQADEESYVAGIVWGGVGWALIFVIAPAALQQLL